jgi:Type III restriction enzyme, res subunit
MKTLHPYPILHTYQDLDLLLLLQYAREAPTSKLYHWAILYCTGAGKTLLSLAFAAVGMQSGEEPPLFTHVLIAAPSVVTRDHFIESDFSSRGHVYKMAEVETADSIEVDRNTALGTPHKVIRTTHALLAGAKMRTWLSDRIAENPSFCKGRLLIIDEAHRTGEELKITEFRDKWLQAGGFVLSLTATPDRSDQTIAIESSAPRVVRTMSKQMSDGFAPKNLRSEILHIDGEAESDTETFNAPKESAQIPIFNHMEQDRYPKSIIRLKSTGNREKHTQDILLLVREAKRRNLRVFVASGHRDDGVDGNDEIHETNKAVLEGVRKRTGTKKGSGDLSEILKYEDSVHHYKDSCLDVIIGMQTVLEGLDWRMCSHLYLIGVPSEILPLAQGIGRPTRDKRGFLTYPEDWRQTSKVVLVVAGNKSEVMEAHSRQTIKVVCYLASFEQWTALSAGSEVFERVHFASPEDKEIASREISNIVEDTPEGETKRRRALQVFTLAMACYEGGVLEEGERPTLHQKARITKLYIDSRQRVQYGDLEEVDILRMLHRLNPSRGRDLASFAKARIEEGADVVEAFRAAHAALDSAKDDFGADPPGIITEALRYYPLQMFTLTSEVMEHIADMVLPTRRRTVSHQPGGIMASVENLRRRGN